MLRHKSFGFSLIILTTLIGLNQQLVKADLFPLSIIHINDFHARYVNFENLYSENVQEHVMCSFIYTYNI